MKKKIAISVLIVVFGLSTIAFGAGSTKTIKALLNGYTVSVDGKKVTNNTIFYNGAVYAPVNVLATGMNGQTNVDNKTKAVSVKSNFDEIDRLSRENNELKSKYADYDSIKSENEKLKSDLTAATTPSINAKDLIGFQKVTLLLDELGYTKIYFEVINNDKKMHSFMGTITFYDGNKSIVGTEVFTVNNLNAGDTNTVTCMTSKDVTKCTWKIQIDTILD